MNLRPGTNEGRVVARPSGEMTLKAVTITGPTSVQSVKPATVDVVMRPVDGTVVVLPSTVKLKEVMGDQLGKATVLMSQLNSTGSTVESTDKDGACTVPPNQKHRYIRTEAMPCHQQAVCVLYAYTMFATTNRFQN